MNERERSFASMHTQMSANRNKLSRLCSRTLQKWRLATIYPDSVFINTNAYTIQCTYILSLSLSHIIHTTHSRTRTHDDDDGVYGRPKSNPFIHIKFSKYYIPIIKHTPLPMASSYTHSDTHHYRSYLFHMAGKSVRDRAVHERKRKGEKLCICFKTVREREREREKE